MKVWRGIVKLTEEMSELTTVLMKLIVVPNGKHWDENDIRSDGSKGAKPLKDRLIDELADVQATLTYFVKKNLTEQDVQSLNERIDFKLNRYEQWVLSGVDEDGLK